MSEIKRISEMNPLLPGIAPEMTDWDIEIDRLDIVFREQWKAELPASKVMMDPPVHNVIFVYTTGTEPCTSPAKCVKAVKAMQDFEMKKVGMPDLKYNFIVGGDGRVYEGRGWEVVAQAPPKYFTLDRKSVNIAFMGDYREKSPPFLMWAAAFKLLAWGLELDLISRYFDFATCKS